METSPTSEKSVTSLPLTTKHTQMGGDEKEERSCTEGMEAHLLQYLQDGEWKAISFPVGDNWRIPVKFASDTQHSAYRVQWSVGQCYLNNKANCVSKPI